MMTDKGNLFKLREKNANGVSKYFHTLQAEYNNRYTPYSITLKKNDKQLALLAISHYSKWNEYKYPYETIRVPVRYDIKQNDGVPRLAVTINNDFSAVIIVSMKEAVLHSQIALDSKVVTSYSPDRKYFYNVPINRARYCPLDKIEYVLLDMINNEPKVVQTRLV